MTNKEKLSAYIKNYEDIVMYLKQIKKEFVTVEEVLKIADKKILMDLKVTLVMAGYINK